MVCIIKIPRSDTDGMTSELHGQADRTTSEKAACMGGVAARREHVGSENVTGERER